MIELLDPRRIKPVEPHLWQYAGWSYRLDYSWVIDQCLKHDPHPRLHNILVDVGHGGSPLGKFLANKCNLRLVHMDRGMGDMDYKDWKPVTPPFIIMWVSSLEHNLPDQMKFLYEKSMEDLAPGGLFLATITIARTTYWFNASSNSNLCVDDALEVFNETKMVGKYDDVHQAYRNDPDIVRRYTDRYHRYDDTDPAFLIAGVSQVKP